MGLKALALVCNWLLFLPRGKCERIGCRRSLYFFADSMYSPIIHRLFCIFQQPTIWLLYLSIGLEQASAGMTGLVIITLWSKLLTGNLRPHYAILTGILALIASLAVA